jgi:type III restriction enzyme
MEGAIDNPILNGPYDPPAEHFEIGSNGPTGEVKPGRRLSESFIPIAAPRKGKKLQGSLDFDIEGERRELNSLINDIRYQAELWRGRGYPGVTSISRKLMQYWADPERENRVLFCQREAAETAIFLAEVAGRQPGTGDFRSRVDEANSVHNNGLPRVGLKMATGAGKTVVMAMLIAWQTINKVYSPRDARFAKRFLVVTPGITIRDRLRVLHPGDDGNYYRERELVPSDLWSALVQAEIAITNYHTFMLRDAKEIKGVASNTRKILTAGKTTDPFKESNDQMVSRVLRDLSGRGSARTQEVVVLNDEAHHCYQDKPIEDANVLADIDAETRREAEQRNADARVWFKGLAAVHHKIGIKSIYDMSATPFYLKGSGYNEGFIFPWVVSDFSLMDAIECGIVKVPRTPVDDDATNASVTYLNLWDHIGKELPKARGKNINQPGQWTPPPALEGALKSLFGSYQKAFALWETTLAGHGETPPVFIVVCPNTVVSKLVYEWIGGVDIAQPDGSVRARKGNLSTLSNVDDEGRWLARPRTVLVDSAQLESGDAMKDDFKVAAHHEIDRFKNEYRRRNPGADIDKITDEDLLREVMNTVGKPGRLGEGVRSVVSVSMLTEGWDANTVTHILGIRRFGSQLLCEQVVGRGLRRRDYTIDETGRFAAEYAEVYGVPFSFIKGEHKVGPSVPKRNVIDVRALAERADLRITFPKLDGYRVELIDEPLIGDFNNPDARLHVSKTDVATWVQMDPFVGAGSEHSLEEATNTRSQQVAFEIADLLVKRFYAAHDAVERPWLFPQLVAITREWLAKCVTYEPETKVGHLSVFTRGKHLAAERIFGSVVRQVGNQKERLVPLMRRVDAEGSTDDVRFYTRKVVIEATKSHVNYVVLDGIKGNTWEETVAGLLEDHDTVAAYVKNDGLRFEIPYIHGGNTHAYVPDFLVRLRPIEGIDTIHTLIVEVSGGRKDQHFRHTKAETARDHWCVSVNNHGGFGRWGYVEISNMEHAESALNNSIEALLARDAEVVLNR